MKEQTYRDETLLRLPRHVYCFFAKMREQKYRDETLLSLPRHAL
jgi:hypothetical protein